MEEELSVLLEKILSEHPKEQVVAALNALAGLSKRDFDALAEISEIIDRTTNQ